MTKVEISVIGKYAKSEIRPRGHHSARLILGHTVRYAPLDVEGRIRITEPGIWYLSTEDEDSGKKARAVLVVTPDGERHLEGDKYEFEILQTRMPRTFFGFEIPDAAFPPNCTVQRWELLEYEAREKLATATCIDPSNKAMLDIAIKRYGLPITVPKEAPAVSLLRDDSIIVMSIRGVPRLEGRHGYTDEELANATFSFGEWVVKWNGLPL